MVKYRRVLPLADEIGYIMKTWGREERKNQPRMYPDRLFYSNFGAIMSGLAKRSDCIVACNPDDINQIIGFAVGKCVPELDIMMMHFAYVRPEFRRLGIGKEMCVRLGYDASRHEMVMTHTSRDVERIDRKGRPIIYNPHSIYRLAP